MRKRSLALFVLLITGWRLYGQESPQDQINSLFSQAHRYFESRELEKAESNWREIVGLSLDQAGTILAALKEFDRAERAFKGAIRASVASASPQIGLGILYLRTVRYEEGLEVAQRVLDINPIHPVALHLRGKLHFMRGDLSAAASDLFDAYQLQPRDISVAYTLALAYLRQDESDEASMVFEQMTQTLGETAQLRVLFGHAFRETGFLEKAIAEFRRAVQLEPSHSRANLYRVMTLLEHEGREAYPEAIEEFRKLLQTDSASYYPNLYLGILYNLTRDYENSVAHLRTAISGKTDSPDPFLYLGQSLLQLDQVAEAITALEKSIELTDDPSRNEFQVANAHYSLGRALARAGRQDEARHHMEVSREFKTQSVEKDAAVIKGRIQGGMQTQDSDTESFSEAGISPSQRVVLDIPEPSEEAKEVLRNTLSFHTRAAAGALLSLARLETVREDFTRAAENLEEALFWDPKLPEVSFNLAVAKVKSGDLAGAVDPLLQTLHENPGKQEARSLLANVALALVQGNQTEPASKAIAYLLQVNPEVPDLHLLQGRLLARQGLFAEALEKYQTALRLNPDIPEAHYHSGTLLIRQARFEEALSELEKELEDNPSHVESLYHKAFILVTHNQLEDAIPLLLRVIQLQPNHADAYFQLGKAHLAKGDLLLAVANLETSSRLNPAASYVFYQLSRAYTRSGRDEEARLALESYQRLKREEEEAQIQRMQRNQEQD